MIRRIALAGALVFGVFSSVFANIAVSGSV